MRRPSRLGVLVSGCNDYESTVSTPVALLLPDDVHCTLTFGRPQTDVSLFTLISLHVCLCATTRSSSIAVAVSAAELAGRDICVTRCNAFIPVTQFGHILNDGRGQILNCVS